MPERFPQVPISGLGESPGLPGGGPQAQNPLMKFLGPAGPQVQAIPEIAQALNPIPSTEEVGSARTAADFAMLLPFLPGSKQARKAKNLLKVKEAKDAARQKGTAEQIFGKPEVERAAKQAGEETARMNKLGSDQALQGVQDAIERIAQDFKGISAKNLPEKIKGAARRKEKGALAVRSKDRVVQGLQEVADSIASVPFALDRDVINEHVNTYLTQVAKQLDVPVSKLGLQKELDRLFGGLVSPSARAKGKRPTPLTREQALGQAQAREKAAQRLSRQTTRGKESRRLFSR